MIDVDVYLEISDLFRRRYDPTVLSAVADGPCRFRNLATRLEGQFAGHVDDNTVSRSLKHLTDANLVDRTMTRFGGRELPVYTITDQGRLAVNLYHAVIDAYRRVQQNSGTA